MHAFLTPCKIIGSGKTSDISATVWKIAFEGFVMLEHVLSTLNVSGLSLV